MSQLEKYGADGRFLAAAALYPGLSLARVVSQYRDLYRIVTEHGEGLAEVSGKFRYEAIDLVEYPAVGDFVMVDRLDMQSGNAVIHQVLARKSAFERTAVGLTGQTQVVAANVDIVLICMSLNSNYNLSRLERYLAVVWNSGATPVVVLTKSDLCDDLAGKLSEISSVALGVDIIATSNLVQASCLPLLSYLQPGVTVSFAGSSGVGKSTLINLLAGEELLATSAVRQDDRGRHTTTRRELLLLPQGGIVIDTPGMRELGAESVDLSRSFADIDELVGHCRFNDCTHVAEPGCAVLDAIASGKLDRRRFESYQKLKKEARYEGLSSRQIEAEKIKTMFDSFGGIKNARDFIKHKSKKR